MAHLGKLANHATEATEPGLPEHSPTPGPSDWGHQLDIRPLSTGTAITEGVYRDVSAAAGTTPAQLIWQDRRVVSPSA